MILRSRPRYGNDLRIRSISEFEVLTRKRSPEVDGVSLWLAPSAPILGSSEAGLVLALRFDSFCAEASTAISSARRRSKTSGSIAIIIDTGTPSIMRSPVTFVSPGGISLDVMLCFVSPVRARETMVDLRLMGAELGFFGGVGGGASVWGRWR